VSTLKFTPAHAWINPQGFVGITDFAQSQLGDIMFIQLPQPGTHFEAGAEAAVIESVKTAGELVMPVSGTVTEVNAQLAQKPELVNESPTQEGWMIRIQPDDPNSAQSLLNQDEYDQQCG
jgi:glycine cleavage system H protein